MRSLIAVSLLGAFLFGLACEAGEQGPAAEAGAGTERAPVEHASNIPPLDPTNIVSLASDSEDHTTLVAAIQAADYVTAVAASGPLTVFAPTNAAFEKLPPGTVEDLLEPENADKLRRILQYHVTTSSLGPQSLRDGQTLGMANGAKATIHVQDGRISINDAEVISSIPASNGMLHVIDTVLLPPDQG